VNSIKNIWSVYYLILIASTLSLLSVSYNKHEELHRSFDLKHSNTLNTLTRSIEANLTENELILDILSERFLNSRLGIHDQKTQKLLKEMLVTKPTLAGFGLVAPNGEFLTTSSNIDTQKLPNLLEHPATSEEFKATLNSQKMVIGRTYYFAPLNSWVIPLRKAIRDTQGKVVAVITTGVKLSDIYKIINFNSNPSEVLTIINSHNHYPLFISHLKLTHFNQGYQTPIPKHEEQAMTHALMDKYGITFKETITRLPDIPLAMSIEGRLSKTSHMSSLIYNSKYALWISLKEPAASLHIQFFHSVIIYLSLFFGVHLILIWTVKRISQHEKEIHETLLFHSDHDALTGLHNRHYLEKNFQLTLPKVTTTISLLFIDLDNFKHINDTFGHSKGDKLLILVAKRLSELLVEATHIIRFGGDEFVVVLTNKTQTRYRYCKTNNRNYLC